jgi:hypothetical protein
MTAIQQVLFKMEPSYAGHPYYVTGNALYSALARRVDAETKRVLNVSHGVFVPGEVGSYPDAHSQSGGVPYLGTSLRPVTRYADLFLFRDEAQRWLSDARPRDVCNTHDIQTHGGRQAFSPVVRFGQPPDSRMTKRTMTWHVHAYLHTGRGDDGLLPLDVETLDGLRVGGARNYGLGELTLADTQVIELANLDYTRVETAMQGPGLTLELLSPYVTASAYPGADSQSVPWWWDVRGDLRRRATRLVKGDDSYPVETIDHGQVVQYTGDDPIRTAINGVLRVGTHAKYGFGEFRLRPADADRVPERVLDGQRGVA